MEQKGTEGKIERGRKIRGSKDQEKIEDKVTPKAAVGKGHRTQR